MAKPDILKVEVHTSDCNDNESYFHKVLIEPTGVEGDSDKATLRYNIICALDAVFTLYSNEDVQRISFSVDEEEDNGTG